MRVLRITALLLTIAGCQEATACPTAPALFPHPLVTFRSINPNGITPSYRWCDGVRWEFGAPNDPAYYDRMQLDGDRLLYVATHSGSSVVRFTPPIGFGGHDGTGAGVSTVNRIAPDPCTGRVKWTWDQHGQSLEVHQHFTGGCGTWDWEESWQWDEEGPVATKGGLVPYQDDAQHWNLVRG